MKVGGQGLFRHLPLLLGFLFLNVSFPLLKYLLQTTYSSLHLWGFLLHHIQYHFPFAVFSCGFKIHPAAILKGTFAFWSSNLQDNCSSPHICCKTTGSWSRVLQPGRGKQASYSCLFPGLCLWPVWSSHCHGLLSGTASRWNLFPLPISILCIIFGLMGRSQVFFLKKPNLEQLW